ncbi:MAG: MalY/PatB family protein [Leadbetterella sp.]
MINFDKSIDRSITNSMKWSKYPKEVLPMWVADMDFEVSESIQKAVKKVADFNLYGYCSVPDDTYEILVSRMKTHHNWQVEKEWIVIMNGMVPALFAVNTMFQDTAISAISNTPIYHNFLTANRQFESIEIPMIQVEGHWEMDFEAIESSIKSNTKLFLLCNPQNPNGRVFTEEELLKLVDICLKNNILLVSDEIHCDLILDDTKKHISVASLRKDIENNSISLFAPSKTFNIPGLGFTFAVIPNAEIRKMFQKAIYGIVPPVNEFAIEASMAAYKYSEAWHMELLTYLKGNHDVLFKEINSISGLKMLSHEATYLAWIDYSSAENKDWVRILEQRGLGVQDSSLFGGRGHFRLNFGTQRSNVEKAINIIRKTFEG